MIKKYFERRKEKKKMQDELNLMKKEYLFIKTKLMMINDKVDEYKKGGNAYTAIRDITNIVKGW